jgi:hypothetical protein
VAAQAAVGVPETTPVDVANPSPGQVEARVPETSVVPDISA